MINPYADIDWANVHRVSSATHMHLLTQKELDHAYRFGIRHCPTSNYYPSVPYREQTRVSDFRLRQWWPTMRHGQPVSPPINWNDLVTWQHELDEPYRDSMPFTESERVFSKIPPGLILSSNAEHHGFTNSGCHVCSPGSSFASGNFDVRGWYHLDRHGYAKGTGVSWQEAFDGILDHLDYPDGGGITINHPTWFSQCSDEQIFEMLDYDERVLGIEIFNAHDVRKDWFKDLNYKPPNEPEYGYSLSMWDRILSSGRRCWGFCVPDHDVQHTAKVGVNWEGRSILLVPEVTDAECLRAYREGRFYGCLKGDGLTVTEVTISSSQIKVRTNASAVMKFISDRDVRTTEHCDCATYDLSAPGSVARPRYVRVEIQDTSGERIFLQPIML